MLVTYGAILKKSGNGVIYPSMESIQGLLRQIHGIKAKVRRLYYARADLVNEKLIRIRPRYDNKPDGTVYQQPPLIAITLKGAFRLYAGGFSWALFLIKKIKSYLNKIDRRFPHPQDIKAEFTEIECDRNLAEVKKLLASIT
ncbi:hypothetical protein ES707_08069 [subsurface metagenome]